MLLALQLMVVLIMIATLIAIYFSDVQGAKKRVPHAKVEDLWVGSERRKHKRFNVQLEAGYIFIANRKNKVNKVELENISLGGVKLLLEEKSKKKAPILIELYLPSAKKPISITSEVAWVADTPKVLSSGKRCYGTGVMFKELSPADKKILSDFINTQIPQE